jgi:type II secretory pathway pseudopilin PulG
MSPEAITIVSGVALLAVFALVGWTLRRNRTRDERADGRAPSPHDPR